MEKSALQPAKEGYIRINVNGDEYCCRLDDDDIKKVIANFRTGNTSYLDAALLTPRYLDCCPETDNEQKQFRHLSIAEGFLVKSKEKLTADVEEELSPTMPQVDSANHKELGQTADIIKKVVTQNRFNWKMINHYAPAEDCTPAELYMSFINFRGEVSNFEICIAKKKNINSNLFELNGFLLMSYSSGEEYILVLSENDCRFLLKNCHSGHFASKKLLQKITKFSEELENEDF